MNQVIFDLIVIIVSLLIILVMTVLSLPRRKRWKPHPTVIKSILEEANRRKK